MTRRGQAGFTMVELMISVVLAGIATAFAFSIYARASQSSRAQSRVAETQQTLRAASQVMSRELRNAGMYAKNIGSGYGGAAAWMRALTVTNSSTGPDSFRIVYADATVRTSIRPSNPFNAAVTGVGSLTGWADGDLAMAVRIGGPDEGEACFLKITALVSGGPKLQHNPGASGSPWNAPQNAQCNNLNDSDWDNGNTLFTKVIMRAYRIKPGDPRGVLQMSPSAEIIPNDWIDMATGIVDMQIAVRLYQEGDGADLDGDGDPEFDWYSGSTMSAALQNTAWRPVQARISLVAKTLAPVNGIQLDKTPDLINTAMPLDNNDVGDRPGTLLPVTDPTSPYYGDNIYRWSSTVVDLRNLGSGVQQ